MTARPEIAARCITLTSNTTEIEHLTDFVRQFLHEHALATQDLMYELRLVIEEILVNIIHHGYGDTPDGRIEVEIALQDHSLRMTFRDSAMAFDPLAGEFDPLENHCDGGMGMELVKSITDSQHYRHDHGRNILTLTKEL